MPHMQRVALQIIAAALIILVRVFSPWSHSLPSLSLKCFISLSYLFTSVFRFVFRVSSCLRRCKDGMTPKQCLNQESLLSLTDAAAVL